MINSCFPFWEGFCRLLGQVNEAVFGILENYKQQLLFLEVDVDYFNLICEIL